jgi:hypothetical protein
LLQKDEEIKELIFSVTEIENYIELLSSPFACFAQKGRIEVDPEDLNQEKIGDHKYYQQEKQMTDTVGRSIEKVAAVAGFRSINWLSLTKALLYCQLVLSCLCQMTKVDFVSMTCVSLALYAVYTPATVKRRFFRTVVAMIFLSLVYDGIYNVMVDPSSNAELDGGY